jgi:hypothetical protein
MAPNQMSQEALAAGKKAILPLPWVVKQGLLRWFDSRMEKHFDRPTAWY